MKDLLGSLTEIWTATEYAAGKCPRLGTQYKDPKTGKTYLFVKNTSASALNAKEACKITSWSAFEVEPNDVASNAAFGGLRVSGATAMTQNTYGWVQVLGSATAIFGTGTNVSSGLRVATLAAVTVSGCPSAASTAAAVVRSQLAAWANSIGYGCESKSTNLADLAMVICSNGWGIKGD